MTLIVCSLSSLPEVMTVYRPSHLLTLLDPVLMIDPWEGLGPGRHLRLGMDDIHAPRPGMVAPSEEMVIQVLAFGRTWDATEPMVVHCFAGVSRSSAAALAIACQRNPDVAELDIAMTLRGLAPHAFPNRRITQIADDMLGRRGRLIAAVESMGPDDLEAPHFPVELPSRFPIQVAAP